MSNTDIWARSLTRFAMFFPTYGSQIMQSRGLSKATVNSLLISIIFIITV